MTILAILIVNDKLETQYAASKNKTRLFKNSDVSRFEHFLRKETSLQKISHDFSPKENKTVYSVFLNDISNKHFYYLKKVDSSIYIIVSDAAITLISQQGIFAQIKRAEQGEWIELKGMQIGLLEKSSRTKNNKKSIESELDLIIQEGGKNYLSHSPTPYQTRDIAPRKSSWLSCCRTESGDDEELLHQYRKR